MNSLYEVLGVAPDASHREIRRAFLSLSRQFHPDVNPDGKARFQDISEAHGILGDERKRKLYDQYGIDFERVVPAVDFEDGDELLQLVMGDE